MPLTLTVDETRWTGHLRDVISRTPGLVPVAKGNGYGFGLCRLARRAGTLGADTLAVGTYDEVAAARKEFSGSVLVLSPWRPFLQRTEDDDDVIHTVGRPQDLAELSSSRRRSRVVLEGLTSMHRHGMSVQDLTRVDTSGVRVEGLALHLAPDRPRLAQVEPWLGLGLFDRLLVSYLATEELAVLSGRHPEVEIRPRVGTSLWLGDREALCVTATVLDVHAVRRGSRAGYRQRRVPSDGHLVVVAGGTAHGIGLRAPTSARSVRDRAAALVKGGLEAAGLALSPFVVDGRQRWFLEPPHMQVSLLFLPVGVAPPCVGDQLPVEARFTTASFDRIVSADGTPLE